MSNGYNAASRPVLLQSSASRATLQSRPPRAHRLRPPLPHALAPAPPGPHLAPHRMLLSARQGEARASWADEDELRPQVPAQRPRDQVAADRARRQREAGHGAVRPPVRAQADGGVQRQGSDLHAA
eukprot:scaffold76623_cov69-Phaeocystis_antarctica.AAC.7